VPEEWVFTGHAPGGDEHPGRVHGLRLGWQDKASLNPDFVKLVKERFSPGDAIHATCRSGGSRAMAISMLAAAESANAYNILDGMEGQPGRLRR
jgi:hypothetical protein